MNIKELLIDSIDRDYSLRFSEKMELLEHINNLEFERDKHKSIVDELKKWLEEESKKVDTYEVGHLTSICMTLNKIKELEEGNSND